MQPIDTTPPVRGSTPLDPPSETTRTYTSQQFNNQMETQTSIKHAATSPTHTPLKTVNKIDMSLPLKKREPAEIKLEFEEPSEVEIQQP